MRCRGWLVVAVVLVAAGALGAEVRPSSDSAAPRLRSGRTGDESPIRAAESKGGLPGAFTPAAPGYPWSFPRDHFRHDGYRNEWWYFTGQLAAVDPPGRRFGYQLTFFRVGLLPRRPDLASPWATADLVMVHAAISDLDGGAHPFSEVLWREIPYYGELASFPRHPVAWARAPAGTPGRWTLDLAGDVWTMSVEDRARGFGYRLAATPERPLVFQGPGGLSRKADAEGYASLYYSFTRLATEGTLTLGGETWKVRGRSWMDREIGSSQLAPAQVGWDWFALQLAGGRDLTLYLLRRADGGVDFARGTLVEEDGTVRWLGAADFTVRATRTWASAASGITYPAAWRVEVPGAGLAFDVESLLGDQENRSSGAGGIVYWEGAVRVSAAGKALGAGYVELTGYGKGSRPPI
jgi:predicted secreted hydrolase